ncbi:MAG: NADH-quinone oxidoreductase subunit C [Chitinophagia bacterium]|nr:NADH-quinone oxidoreductase subunit C [Chitinophagia bacterium]
MSIHANNDIVIQAVNGFTDSKAVSSLDDYGMLNFVISKDQVVSAIQQLRDNHGFIFLTDLCGAHYPERKGSEFEVIYHLHNLVENQRVRLKVGLSESEINVPTLTGLFAGANWMERETFDFYGVNFVGHPDLRRILNMDDMDYHPLRKQYALEDETRTDKNDTFFGR